MIDRIFTAGLAFCLLIGTTLAIASAWFEPRSGSRQQVVRLPAVEVAAQREANPNAQVVQLPAVHVTSKRQVSPIGETLQLPAVHVVVKRAAPQAAPLAKLPATVATNAIDSGAPCVQ